MKFPSSFMGGQDVSEVQERYLEGFTSGLTIAQRLHGLPGPARAGRLPVPVASAERHRELHYLSK